MAHLWGMDFVNNMVFFSLGVLVPIWREDLGLTPTQAGLLGTAGFMGFGLMALPASIWLTRYSPKLVTLAASVGMAGFTMLQAASPVAVLLMLSRLGFVICSAVRIQLQVMLIQQWFRPRLFATVNSLDYGTRSTGQVIALAATPGLVMLLGSWRSHYFFVGVLLLLITLSWVFLGRERRTRPEGDGAMRHEPNPAGVLRRNKTMWMVATAQLGVAVCFGSFLTFYPSYAIDKLDISLETAGLLMSAFPVGGVCGTLASGPLSQWVGRRKPFVFIPGIVLPIAYSLLLQAPSVPVAALVLFVIGLSAMGTAPILFTIPMDLRLPHREVAVAQGLMRTLFPFSAMWGPLFVGLMQESTGSLFVGLMIVAPLNITLFINGVLMPETGIRGRLDRMRATRTG